MKKANAEPVHAFLTVQRDSTIDVIRQLLGRSNAPTALFCANNYVTRHVLHALQSLGVPVPKRVALVGFDDFEMADLMRPAITVVRQPAEQLGHAAAEALFTRLSEESPQTSGTPHNSSRNPLSSGVPAEPKSRVSSARVSPASLQRSSAAKR